MSLELLVILAASKAPDLTAWDQALSAAHVPASFAASADLPHHTGFLPVKVEGRDTGFYFLTESYAELATQYPTIANIGLEKPTVYSLGYGGHRDECAAVFFSASVLVSRFGGVAFDPQDDALMSAEQLSDAAKQCLTLLPK